MKYTVEVTDAYTVWYKQGTNIIHREDGPAYDNGNKSWYFDGKLHREDGPAVEYADGSKHWYVNGKLHREDGPAIEYASGGKHWFINGSRHRIEGSTPIEKEWWIDGVHYSEKRFLEITKNHSCDGKIVEIDGKKYKLTEVNDV